MRIGVFQTIVWLTTSKGYQASAAGCSVDVISGWQLLVVQHTDTKFTPFQLSIRSLVKDWRLSVKATEMLQPLFFTASKRRLDGKFLRLGNDHQASDSIFLNDAKRGMRGYLIGDKQSLNASRCKAHRLN